jgi:hypothetical protein
MGGLAAPAQATKAVIAEKLTLRSEQLPIAPRTFALSLMMRIYRARPGLPSGRPAP